MPCRPPSSSEKRACTVFAPGKRPAKPITAIRSSMLDIRAPCQTRLEPLELEDACHEVNERPLLLGLGLALHLHMDDGGADERRPKAVGRHFRGEPARLRRGDHGVAEAVQEK